MLKEKNELNTVKNNVTLNDINGDDEILYNKLKELRFEYLSGLGQWGEVLGVFTAAREGVVDNVSKHMEALISLDPEDRKRNWTIALACVNFRLTNFRFHL